MQKMSFREFLLMNEGGNVQIGDQEASRITFTRMSRSDAVKIVDGALKEINAECKRITGVPLWNKRLYDSKKFLSGSSYSFFMTGSISDEDFVSVKSSVGDIDTQCDVNMAPLIEKFLDSITGKKWDDFKFIGYKDSGTQYITLWHFPKFEGNVQIDFELVEFDEKGFPTAWSQFSHSSAWEDMKQGIKGYHHKVLLQALDAPRFKEMIIKAKTARGKDKKLFRGTHSFSVSHGVREKMVPVTDDKGNVIYFDGLPAYKELSTKESFGNTDLDFIFQHFFGIAPTPKEINQMGSFVGTIDLIKKNFSRSDWEKIADAYATKMWGPGAQGLYRDNPQLDLDEKTRGMNYLADLLKLKTKKYDELKRKYYASYK